MSKSTIDSELISFKEGPSPVLGVFLIAVSCGFGYGLTLASDSPTLLLVFGYTLCSLFFLFGFSATCCSVATEIDIKSSQARRIWRVFGLSRKQFVAPFASFQSVRISIGYRSGGEDDPRERVFKVSLQHSGQYSKEYKLGKFDYFDFGDHDSLQEASSLAARISEATSIPVQDETES